eukprot:1930148-Prymnesium_polylepis.1
MTHRSRITGQREGCLASVTARRGFARGRGEAHLFARAPDGGQVVLARASCLVEDDRLEPAVVVGRADHALADVVDDDVAARVLPGESAAVALTLRVAQQDRVDSPIAQQHLHAVIDLCCVARRA